MNVLIACEESQEVCKAFREKRHRAFSCDILECSGGHPEWHIKQDVLKIMRGGEFRTMDGMNHYVSSWDMIIAFPPCTHLASSGARHFKNKRKDGRQREGIEFFANFLKSECKKVVIENPVGIISGDYIPKWYPDLAERYQLPKKPTQIIQPYMFGDNAKKTTCLWIKGVEKLKPTNIVDPGEFYISPKGRKISKGASSDMAKDDNGKILAWNDPRTSKIRSKTFPGIAKAMAEQWG